MINIILVGIGGAIGAVFRYIISLIPFQTSFPFATFITNILGAFLIGIIAGAADRTNISPRAVLLLKTGVCGGFTTFSTFSLESWNLLSSGKIAIGAVYMALSLCCCVAGVAIGQMLVKRI